MVKRPIHSQFNEAVLAGRKFTTIRKKPWRRDQPVMLYNWTGKPYRSKQQNVAAVEVTAWWPIWMTHWKNGDVTYDIQTMDEKPIHESEGFSSREEMDAWFRKEVPKGTTEIRYLMRFRLLKTKN